MGHKAVFLDRDGVLNKDVGYCGSIARFELYSFAAEAVRQENARGYLVIVVTNQSGIARGHFTHQDVDRLHRHCDTLMQQAGASITQYYYCPHHPERSVCKDPTLCQVCSCRKPKPGMLFQAAAMYGIHLAESVLIGDSARDIEAGRAAGVRTIGVLTGNGCVGSPAPDVWADTVLSAVMLL